MSFADTFAQPFTRTVDGKTYTVKLLTTRDYLPWLAELAEQRKAGFAQDIPADTSPPDQYTIRRAIRLYEVTPDALLELIATGPGTIRVLEMAAKKSGVPDAELAAFVDGNDPRQNLKDAFRASALLSAEAYLNYFPEELAPNDTLVVLTRISKLSDTSRTAMAQVLLNPTLSPAQLRTELAKILAVPEAPAEEPDPNAQALGETPATQAVQAAQAAS